MIKAVINCMSLRSLPMSIACVAFGTAVAILRGYGDSITAVACLIFAMLAQLEVNLCACYVKAANPKRVLELDMAGEIVTDSPVGSVPPKKVLLESMKLLGVLVALAALALLVTGGPFALVLGAILLFCVYINNFANTPRGRNAIGAFVAFLCFGPVAVLGTYLLQVEHTQNGYFPLPPMIAATTACVISGIYALNVIMVYNITTYDYDMAHSLQTMATLFGKNKIRNLFLISCTFLMALEVSSVFWMPDMPYHWEVFSAGIISYLINIVIFKKLGTRNVDSKNLQNLAMWNMLFVALVVFVVFLIGGIADVDTKHYF